jgi:hypothetical protein
VPLSWRQSQPKSDGSLDPGAEVITAATGREEGRVERSI